MFKRTIIPAVVAVFAMVACSKGFQESEPVRAGSTEVHSLSVGIEAGAYLPADETRATMEAIVRAQWQKDDEISVVNATTGKLLGGCLKATGSGEVVTFTGDVTGEIGSGNTLYYIYPRIKDNDTEEDFAGYEISLDGQEYYNNNSGNVCFYGYATSKESLDANEKLKFTLVTAYVHLNMSNIPAKGADLTSIDISNINGGFKWVYDNGAVSAEYCYDGQGISVTCYNTKITNAGNAVVRFAVPASPATQEARVLTVNKAYSNSDYIKNERESGKYYNQIYSRWNNNVTVEDKGDNTEVTIDNGDSKESAEGVLPAEQAFNPEKPASIEVGGIGNITFNAEASKQILNNAKEAGSTNIFFKVENVTETKPVENADIVYEVTMKALDQNGTEVFCYENAAGEATVEVPLGDDVVSVQSVSLVDESGNVISGGVVENSVKFENSILSFRVNHFSKYAINYTKKGEVTVAKIGTTKYPTLSEALSAAKDGEAVYIIPAQLEETVKASNDNNIQLILDGKILTGDITFGGKGTLIVRAEELNTDYYHWIKSDEATAPTIPAQGVGGIMGKISATDDATVMLRENLYSGPFEGNVELRGGYYYYELGLDNIKAQTPNGIGIVVDEIKDVQGHNMYYVPEVPESYLVHIPAEFLAAGLAGDLTPEQIQQATLGYWLNEEQLLNPMWVKLTEDGSISLDDCLKGFPDDVFAFFTNLKDNDSENPKYAYQNWVCDFVISYSQPIAEDYKSGIWGYYSERGFGCWLPKSATNNPVGLMRSTFGPWEYSRMLSTVGMFLCGPKNLNPADAGKVITVELNIYPDSETAECITTNKVVYTIPAISE